MASGFSGGTPGIGTRVMAADGVELGEVKEISGDCFKVDAPMERDYWLATDCIASGRVGNVTVNFTKAKLDDAKVDVPGHSGVHSHDQRSC